MEHRVHNSAVCSPIVRPRPEFVLFWQYITGEPQATHVNALLEEEFCDFYELD